jgi:hypothetical protein
MSIFMDTSDAYGRCHLFEVSSPLDFIPPAVKSAVTVAMSVAGRKGFWRRSGLCDAVGRQHLSSITGDRKTRVSGRAAVPTLAYGRRMLVARSEIS